jgi:hypothetical protein
MGNHVYRADVGATTRRRTTRHVKRNGAWLNVLHRPHSLHGGSGLCQIDRHDRNAAFTPLRGSNVHPIAAPAFELD